MRINVIAGSLGMMWVAVAMGTPLTMFLERLGASGVLIGLTATVQQLAMLLQVPSSLFTERLAARKPFWAVVIILQRLLWFAPAVLALCARQAGRAAGPIMVGIVALSAVLTHVVTAAWWSWITDLIPERLRGSFWGKRQSAVTAANVLAVWGAGYLLDRFPDPIHPGGTFAGFAIVFALAAVAGTVDIVVHLGVPEPRRPPRRETSMWRQVLAPLRNRDFLRVTLAVGAWTFGVGLVGQFGVLCLTREFAVTYMQLSATTISAAIGVIAAGLLWGYVMDRLGARNLGAITLAIAPFFGLAWFFMRPESVALNVPWVGAIVLPQPILILLGANVVSAVFYSGVGLAQVGLLAATTPVEGRTLAMAVHWSLVGLMAALGPVAGGAVMDWLTQHPPAWRLPSGARFTFFHALVLLHMAVSWLAALPLLLRVTRRPGEVGVRTAFSRLMVGNPLRAVSSVYNILAMNVAVSSRRRASAMRRLGAERTALALTDLIANLDDPAAEVREAAVMALGRIGSPEAVDALLARLNDPQTDLIPQIARALRDARSPRSVEPLIRRLSDSDRETVAEAARTLGEIGDRSAAAALLKLLRGTKDAKVISAASEALARLGEMAAIYEILPRMCGTSNPVLKRSLAVVVGDLLGRPGEFYGVLVQDQRAPGAEAQRLLRILADRIAEATPGSLAAQGAKLIAKGRDLHAAYETDQVERCVDLLIELAIGLAALHYGIEFGGDVEVFMETLIWHDVKFALGLWFHSLLRERLKAVPRRPVDRGDVLLGIYALSGWTPSPPPA
jgi:MFS family permease